MNPNRRSFVQTLIAALTVPWVAAQQPQQRPTMPPTPAEPFPDAPKIDPKVVLKHNQQQIHDDVLKLYSLAGELKDQVSKTDSTSVLSMGLVQKAEEVEKLAKQIKTLARGS